MRYLIVGAGAAGISAAERIRSLDPYGEIILYSAEPEGYYSRPALAYYLSREIKRASLFPWKPSDFTKNRIDLRKRAIHTVLPAEKKAIDSEGAQVRYDKLLLATGAEAARPQIEGSELDGVVYLDSLAETERIIGKTARRKKGIVVGGGITALEIVEGLLSRKMEVHFLLRKKHYWNRVLDQVESDIVLRRLEADGVYIHRDTTLTRIIGKRGKVTGVEIGSGKTLPADLVAFAIGVRPRPDLFHTAGLETRRGIPVNQYMETNLQDIYAAGDAAETYDLASQSWVIDCLWPVARQQGLAAGSNMAGKQIPYQRRSPINVTRLARLTTTIIGQVGSPSDEDEYSIVRGESESWQKMPDAVVCQKGFEVNRLRLMVGQEFLLGAVLMGDQSLSTILEDLVSSRASIQSIRDQLIQPGADLPNILIRFQTKRRES